MIGNPPSSTPPPLLSVVIPVYDVEPYLQACLRSVLDQTLVDLEVIVVDDGSTDGTLALARGIAAEDPRVRVLTQANAGQGDARNRGVAVARGRYLIFADGDDLVPRPAYATLVGKLEASGSDFVLAPVLRLRVDGRLAPPVWNAAVYDHERTGIRIDQFPVALLDVVACNRMFRREFWDEQAGPFEGGIAYEDHVPMVRAFLEASSFDVVTTPAYTWRVRADGSSTRQQKHLRQNLLDRLSVKEEAWALVRSAAPEVRSAWLARVLDLDLASYLRSALEADDEYRQLLQEAMARYLAAADDRALGWVRVMQRLLAGLAAAGRWDQVATVLRRMELSAGELPATVVEDQLVVVPEVLTEMGLEAGTRLSQIGELESRLRVCLSDLRRDDRSLLLTGWAVVGFLDTEAHPPELEAELVDLDRGGCHQLAVEPDVRPAATDWSRQRYASADRGGFRLAVDLDELRRASQGVTGGPARWQLRLTVRVGRLERQGAVRSALTGSLAALDPTRPGAERAADGISARFHPEHGLVLEVDRSEAIPPADRPLDEEPSKVVAVEVMSDHVQISLTGPAQPGRLTGPAGIAPAAITVHDDGRRWDVPLTVGRFGHPAPLPTGSYGLHESDGARLLWHLQGDPPTLPVDVLTSHHRVRVEVVGATGALRLRLSARLGLPERTALGQQRLRDAHRREALGGPGAWGGRRDGLMVINTQRGARPDLVALADAALREGVPVCWEVTDPSRPAPAGATPVGHGTRRWFELLATSGLLLAADRFPTWLPEQPGQRRLAVQGAVSASSTHGVTPSGLSTTVVPEGVARREALRSADPAVARARVTQALGLAEGAPLVLAAGPVRKADQLRIAAAALELGPSTSVLVAQDVWSRPPTVPGLLDVSGWLRPWELLAAADHVVEAHRATLADLTGGDAGTGVPRAVEPVAVLIPATDMTIRTGAAALLPADGEVPTPSVTDLFRAARPCAS